MGAPGSHEVVSRALYAQGFEPVVLPGEPTTCRRGELSFDPEGELREAAESGDTEGWRRRVREAGVADARL